MHRESKIDMSFLGRRTRSRVRKRGAAASETLQEILTVLVIMGFGVAPLVSASKVVGPRLSRESTHRTSVTLSDDPGKPGGGNISSAIDFGRGLQGGR